MSQNPQTSITPPKRRRLYLTHDMAELTMAYVMTCVFTFGTWQVWHYDMLAGPLAPMAVFMLLLLPPAGGCIYMFLFCMSGSGERRKAAEGAA